MRKPKTTHQIRRLKGLTRLGGADSKGSTVLAADTGSRRAETADRALASAEPNVKTLAGSGGAMQYADADYVHGEKTRGKVDMPKTSVSEQLRSRQFKGKF